MLSLVVYVLMLGGTRDARKGRLEPLKEEVFPGCRFRTRPMELKIGATARFCEIFG